MSDREVKARVRNRSSSNSGHIIYLDLVPHTHHRLFLKFWKCPHSVVKYTVAFQLHLWSLVPPKADYMTLGACKPNSHTYGCKFQNFISNKLLANVILTCRVR